MSGMMDLSLLPAPDFVETLDTDTIVAALKQDLAERIPSLTASLQLESEPLVKQLEAAAYREFLIRARVNQAALAVLLPFATGSDLDAIGARYGLKRKVLVEEDLEADPQVFEELESDPDFRKRIQLSPLSYSTAGPRDAWVFHALSAHADVKDVVSLSPTPRNVTVSILSRIADGTPSAEVLAAITEKLTDDALFPQGDVVTIQGANIEAYTIQAELTMKDGPDAALALQAAIDAAQAYATKQHYQGANVRIAGIMKALMQEGVENAQITAPLADVIGEADAQDPADPGKAPYATSIVITSAA